MDAFFRSFILGLVIGTAGNKLGWSPVTSVLIAVGLSITIESLISNDEGDDDNA